MNVFVSCISKYIFLVINDNNDRWDVWLRVVIAHDGCDLLIDGHELNVWSFGVDGDGTGHYILLYKHTPILKPTSTRHANLHPRTRNNPEYNYV